jgi:electron transport complex protein RnfG
MNAESGALPVLETPQVPSWRLLATLGGAGALAGLFIVLVYGWTLPRIEAHRAMVLRDAIDEVLHAPARADTLFLERGVLVAAPVSGARDQLERVYLGYDSAGAPTGYAIVASEPGFQDQITLIFGYDPVGREVLGMKVLESRETPGLGDKIERPAFTAQFAGRVAPLTGVKGAPPAGDASAVVMVTGATISSRAVVEEINAAVSRWQPLIESYHAGGRP